jgi:hypothetical protein
MFVQGTTAYPRPRRRRGFGRIILLAAVMLIASARLAYGSGPVHYDRVVVNTGDTVWSIAAAHFSGDPRSHIDAILAANRLASPSLTPGQTLLIPQN